MPKKKFLFQLFVILLCVVLVYLFPQVFNPTAKQHVPVVTANGNITLFQEPQAGSTPFIAHLNAAKSEILVEMYLLTDKGILTALEDAAARGVTVKVMLEQHPFEGGALNQKTYTELASKNVSMQWTNQDFALTHEKAIIIDQKELFVLNQNFTTTSFKKNREYNVLDTDQIDVAQARAIFQADWDKNPIQLSESHLIVSPYNARESLESLLKNSTTSIEIEMEVLTDPEIMNLLEESGRQKLTRVILADYTKVAANQKSAEELQNYGVQVRTLKNPYIHAKLIIVDQKTAYIGSVNFTAQSMDKNRELGILISEHNTLQELHKDFEEDWTLAQ